LTSVLRRLRLAALLHDQVVIEAGIYRANAGPNGSFGSWQAADPDQPPRWQTTRERSAAMRNPFHVALRPSDAPDTRPFHRMIESPTSIAWRPTFEPLKAALPVRCDWVEFLYTDLTPEGQSLVSRLNFRDRSDDLLGNLIPEPFVRNLVMEHANHDFVVGVGLGAVVSVDAQHTPIIRARLAHREAGSILGQTALSIAVPDDRDLDWETVSGLRRHRDWRYFRDVLREIEADAREGATSPADFERRVRTMYEARLSAARDRISALGRSNWITRGLGMVVGEIVPPVLEATMGLSGVPGVGTVIGEGVSEVANSIRQHRERPRWLAAHDALTRPSSKR
jgi:hypothetical protein